MRLRLACALPFPRICVRLGGKPQHPKHCSCDRYTAAVIDPLPITEFSLLPVRRFDGMRAGAGNASGSGTAFYYSFDLGLVHYVAIDTELFAYGKETARSLSPVTRATQLAWLEQDLAAADANRAEVPWVVVFGHKGWYMAYYKTPAASYYQVDFSDFATLFDTYKVDLYLSGHNHLYQRFLPLAAPTECVYLEQSLTLHLESSLLVMYAQQTCMRVIAMRRALPTFPHHHSAPPLLPVSSVLRFQVPSSVPGTRPRR